MALSYAVIGTGALGGYYGGRLANSGKEVHFLLRSDFEHVKKNGLQVDSINGDFVLNPVSCFSSADDMPVCDVVLVCLKTTSNELLPELLKPIIHKDSLVILIQNGLGVEEKLEEEMPNLNIAGALAFICSHKIGDGHIQHLDLGRLILGLHSEKGTNVLEAVCADFVDAGVPAILSDNLKASRWQKLVWNVPFNGLAVALNTTTDKLMEYEPTRQLAHEMMLEVIEAAKYCGFPLGDEFADKMIKTTAQMKPYAPSMKLDFDFKRPLEIEAIYSRPVQEAAQAGYPMKKVAMLEKQLLFIQQSYLQK